MLSHNQKLLLLVSVSGEFGKVFKRKYIQKEITSPRESQKRQIMPAALKIMLRLLNNAKSYASTNDNSLPTYFEVRFEKRTFSTMVGEYV